MNMDLKDKRAVISGGSVGIGLAVAHGLAAKGVHVARLHAPVRVPRNAPPGSRISTG